MKLFLWRQNNHHIESSVLLQWSMEEYETAKQNLEPYGESDLDSLFAFLSTEGEEPLEKENPFPVLQVIKTEKGKPVVVDGEGNPYPLHLSVTHTADWWICAVGEYPMGIDAELKSREVKPSLVRHICTQEEREWLNQELKGVAERDREEELRRKLLWLWVRKEAYVKYLGTGIGEGLKTFSVVERQGDGTWKEKAGFQTVDFEEELEVAVYSPWEEIEEILWRKW